MGGTVLGGQERTDKYFDVQTENHGWTFLAGQAGADKDFLFFDGQAITHWRAAVCWTWMDD